MKFTRFEEVGRRQHIEGTMTYLIQKRIYFQTLPLGKNK